MGFLLMCSSGGRRSLATWAFLAVPTGFPRIGAVMSDDTRPGAVYWERFRAVGCGHEQPSWLLGSTVAAAKAAYVAPPSRDTRCRPPEAAFSPASLDELAGSGADLAPGAEWVAKMCRSS
jgi:hypothetical protein